MKAIFTTSFLVLMLLKFTVAQQTITLPPAFCAAEFAEDSSRSVNVTVSDPDPAIKGLVDRIMSFTGLKQNFTLKSYTRFNAEALIRNEDGQNKRYIFYSSVFVEQIRKKAGEWGLIGTLAHEIAHHLQGHTVEFSRSSPKIELEADHFAGFVMAKMGATLEQAQSAFDVMSANIAPPGTQHPVRDDRLSEVKKGWIEGGGTTDLTSTFLKAARVDDVQALKKILATGFAVNTKDEHGRSALHMASESDKVDAVRFLLQNGANPDIKGDLNITPLFAAVQNNNVEIVKMLLDHGASVNAQAKSGTNALTAAIGWRTDSETVTPEIVAILVKAGIDSSQRHQICGCTPLHVAVRRKSFDVVRELLKSKSIRVNATDDEGHTPMDWADEGTEIEKLLKRAGGKKLKPF